MTNVVDFTPRARATPACYTIMEAAAVRITAVLGDSRDRSRAQNAFRPRHDPPKGPAPDYAPEMQKKPDAEAPG